MTGLSLSVKSKGKSYTLIFVTIDCLIKIVHYKLVKPSINVSRLARIIINMVLD